MTGRIGGRSNVAHEPEPFAVFPPLDVGVEVGGGYEAPHVGLFGSAGLSSPHTTGFSVSTGGTPIIAVTETPAGVSPDVDSPTSPPADIALAMTGATLTKIDSVSAVSGNHWVRVSIWAATAGDPTSGGVLSGTWADGQDVHVCIISGHNLADYPRAVVAQTSKGTGAATGSVTTTPSPLLFDTNARVLVAGIVAGSVIPGSPTTSPTSTIWGITTAFVPHNAGHRMWSSVQYAYRDGSDPFGPEGDDPPSSDPVLTLPTDTGGTGQVCWLIAEIAAAT